MTFRQFLLVIRARWRLAFSIFAAVIVAACLVSWISPKQYTATASVVVDAKVDPIAGIVNPGQLTAAYLATQVDIVSSERVAERVVKMLHLDQVPEFQEKWQKKTNGRGDLTAWLANILQKRVVVTPSRESNVIGISATWPDAKAAAALANSFAKAYIDTTIDLKVEPEKQYATWFDQRSQELRLDLESKQKRLSDFQKETQITATDEHLDIENGRLVELSSQLTAIQGQRQDSESRQRQIAGNNESLPEVLQSPVIASLKGDLALDEAKLKHIATTLGKNHPEYQTTEAEIASLRDRMTQETAKIASSLGNITQTNVHREAEIQAALEAQKKRVLELKHQRDQMDVLQGDVTTAQHNLDAVTQRLAQSSLASQIQQTNVLVLTTATEPALPTSPNLLLNSIVGMFLGAVFGIGAAILRESSDPRVYSDEALVRLLSVPLLGKISSAKAWITSGKNSDPPLAQLESPSS